MKANLADFPGITPDSRLPSGAVTSPFRMIGSVALVPSLRRAFNLAGTSDMPGATCRITDCKVLRGQRLCIPRGVGEERKLGVIFLGKGLDKPWQVSFTFEGVEIEVLLLLIHLDLQTRDSPLLLPLTSRWFWRRKHNSAQPESHFLPGRRLRVAGV